MGKKGSNKAKCADYKSFGIRNKNKRRKLNKHLAKFPNDKDAAKALKLI